MPRQTLMVVLCLLGLVSIFFGILDDIESVVAHIHSVDPDIRVVYSIYDYVNVGNGFPAPLALFASAIERRARSIRHFYLVNNLGLLHHTFGYTGAFGPGETPLPGGFPTYMPLPGGFPTYMPLLGGDPTRPGDPELFRDEIHATTEGYLALAQHSVDEFFLAWLGPQFPVGVTPLGNGGVLDPSHPGLVAVSVPSSAQFDAATIAPGTLAFGPLGVRPVRWLPEGLLLDLDRDGRQDRLVIFPGDAGFIATDTSACVQFDRSDGLAAQGCAAIAIATPAGR